jgi:5-methylcytosine-specific restriction enzyme A
MKRGRIYDTRQWKSVRSNQLQREPFCRVCVALGDPDNPACHVDHIIPIERGGAPYDPGNLQSLCGPHHSFKTNHFDVKGLDWSAHALPGCAPDGSPLDPSHPFHAGSPAPRGAFNLHAASDGDRARPRPRN